MVKGRLRRSHIARNTQWCSRFRLSCRPPRRAIANRGAIIFHSGATPSSFHRPFTLANVSTRIYGTIRPFDMLSPVASGGELIQAARTAYPGAHQTLSRLRSSVSTCRNDTAGVGAAALGRRSGRCRQVGARAGGDAGVVMHGMHAFAISVEPASVGDRGDQWANDSGPSARAICTSAVSHNTATRAEARRRPVRGAGGSRKSH
ncbi:hypothetical protein LAUMK191_04086 [Mycobacterium attenuatum]|nr:hypothetical protein LAUMK191_04086 [Mycobacterium attenuatum]VBA60826.1 hypothetical protein LAUMK41_04223 [Mycobacterium attenuatum]